MGRHVEKTTLHMTKVDLTHVKRALDRVHADKDRPALRRKKLLTFLIGAQEIYEEEIREGMLKG